MNRRRFFTGAAAGLVALAVPAPVLRALERIKFQRPVRTLACWMPPLTADQMEKYPEIRRAVEEALNMDFLRLEEYQKIWIKPEEWEKIERGESKHYLSQVFPRDA